MKKAFIAITVLCIGVIIYMGVQIVRLEHRVSVLQFQHDDLIAQYQSHLIEDANE